MGTINFDNYCSLHWPLLLNQISHILISINKCFYKNIKIMMSFQISKSALRMASSLVTYATKKKSKKIWQLKKQMLVPCVLIIMFFLFSCTRIPNKLFHTQTLTQLHGCTSPAFFFGHKSSNEASKRRILPQPR